MDIEELKKDIIERVQNCHDMHWISAIYHYIKALLK